MASAQFFSSCRAKARASDLGYVGMLAVTQLLALLSCRPEFLACSRGNNASGQIFVSFLVMLAARLILNFHHYLTLDNRGEVTFIILLWMSLAGSCPKSLA